MLRIDQSVMDNYCRIMRNYNAVSEVAGKADCFYEFETVVKFNGVPIGKAFAKGDNVSWNPVGSKKGK